MFRRALAKEDAARIRKLCELAASAGSLDAYMKDGMFIGWTRGDLRTGELKEELEPLMKAIFAFQNSPGAEGLDEAITAAWGPFDRHRIRTLVHCL